MDEKWDKENDIIPDEKWDEGNDIIPFLEDFVPEARTNFGVRKSTTLTLSDDNKCLSAFGFVSTGDIVELYDEARGIFIGSGEWWPNISVLSQSWFPTLRSQGPLGWKIFSTTKSESSHHIPYGSTIRLGSTEIEAGTHVHLCSWLSTYVYSDAYDERWAECYEWRILSATDGEPSPKLKYGDKIYLMNVFYSLFLAQGVNPRFLATVPNRKDACVFTIRPHLRLPATAVEELQNEKKNWKRKNG